MLCPSRSLQTCDRDRKRTSASLCWLDLRYPTLWWWWRLGWPISLFLCFLSSSLFFFRHGTGCSSESLSWAGLCSPERNCGWLLHRVHSMAVPPARRSTTCWVPFVRRCCRWILLESWNPKAGDERHGQGWLVDVHYIGGTEVWSLAFFATSFLGLHHPDHECGICFLGGLQENAVMTKLEKVRTDQQRRIEELTRAYEEHERKAQLIESNVEEVAYSCIICSHWEAIFVQFLYLASSFSSFFSGGDRHLDHPQCHC